MIDINLFFNRLGIQLSRTGDSYMARCPFAQWTHSTGTDSTASWGVYQTDHGNWRYNCFTCGEKGTLRNLLYKLMDYGQKIDASMFSITYDMDFMDDDYEVAGYVIDTDKELDIRDNKEADKYKKIRVVEKDKICGLDYAVGGRSLKKAVYRKKERFINSIYGALKEDFKEVVLDEVPVEKYNRLLKTDIPEYWYKRGFSEDIYRQWGVGHDEADKRVVFIVRDWNGRVVGTSGRTYWEGDFCFRCGTSLKQEDAKKNLTKCPKCGILHTRYKHSYGKWRRNVFYGEHLYEKGYPIVVVEGPTDVIRLSEYGVRCPLGLQGSKINPYQVQTLAHHVGEETVYLMGDGDEEGGNMNNNFVKFLSYMNIKTKKILLPKGKDPDSLSREEVLKLLPSECFR